jgi:hypothetical protein
MMATSRPDYYLVIYMMVIFRAGPRFVLLAVGSVTVNIVCTSGTLCTEICPPCACTIACTRLNPNLFPDPDRLLSAR